MTQCLFVYGTLRQGAETYFSAQLRRRAVSIGLAYLRAQLFLIEDYPGAVDSNNQNHRVLGEVYTLPQGEDRTDLLRFIDQYEECGPNDPPPTEYIRVERPVELLSGEMIIAYVYLYNCSIEQLTLIEDGDFLSIKDGQKIK